MPKCLATSLAVVVLSACTVEVDQSTNGQAPCSAETYELIEKHIKISDAEGHGPDLGSSSRCLQWSDDWALMKMFQRLMKAPKHGALT